ncbi:MAG: class I SAM-dependent methyltransferase [Chlamydiae bacterium]|nr:class I SAM-dependent methyltransferase [Chlamydiota bacterium]
MSVSVTKEIQNQSQIDAYQERGPATMGPWTTHIWRNDPRHLAFLLSRYKFCSKILSGKENVLEVGCGDAFGTPIVLQSVKSVHGIDFEPLVLAEAQKNMQAEFSKRCAFSVHDMLKAPLNRKFDAAYSLDVIEHIPLQDELKFLSNICASLKREAICIIGTPNIEASRFASVASAEGHINLKSADTLRQLLLKRFENVLIFSMNDEVVHTGYYAMAHYLLSVGVGLRNNSEKI